LHWVFIDLEKAFDLVPREELWTCMREAKIPEQYVKIVQDMYTYQGCTIYERSPVGDTEEFEVTVGLHQGSALSPFLFLIIPECLTKAIKRGTPWEMLFADDVVLICKTRLEAEPRLELSGVILQKGKERKN
jgi:hypothetical protein